ncbi:MAG: hypothetical protein [Caudoviricetes sp.]|nr:MAG: hypothetical protein [Caudoviricetes sp.]
MMKSKEIIVGDNDHLVTLTFGEHYVEFTIQQIESISTVEGDDGPTECFNLNNQLEGSVKWDGCSNVTADGWMHFCEPQHFVNMNKALQIAYNEAALYFNAKRESWQDELPMWEDE